MNIKIITIYLILILKKTKHFIFDVDLSKNFKINLIDINEFWVKDRYYNLCLKIFFEQ